MPDHIIILAAGQGKRMRSDLAKVAHVAAGKPLLTWVLDAARPLDASSTVAVVGHGARDVEPLLPEGVTAALQAEQLGTGHATRIGLDVIGDVDANDTIIVLNGDMPVMTTETLQDLAVRSEGVVGKLITADLEDPNGYGRVIRDGSGAVAEIIEDGDCTNEQREIREINAGAYSFRAGELMAALDEVSNNNAQHEYYLTDVAGILAGRGLRIEPVKVSPEEVVGINSQDQLAEARLLLQHRTNQRLMESGVWMLDPERTYVDDGVEVEPGAKIYPGVHLEGVTKVGADTQVGPDTFVVDSTIGAHSRVWYSVLRGATVGDNCEVGPYASLRPGTVMESGSKLGTFVETKNMTLGPGAKAPHLSYLGDATIGARANVGAGTITCNYDGYEKHPTEIGEDAFIGSDTMLVAPVRIGDRAITGAGSVITRDVEDGALAVERNNQEEIPGYAERRAERQTAREAED